MRFAITLLPLSPLLAACASAQDIEPVDPVASETVTGTLFVANKRGDSVSQIDLASGEERLRVPACTRPDELAASPDGLHVAVGCYGGSSLVIFEAADLTRVTEIELGEGARPHGIVWHSNGDIYATAEGRDSMFWVKEPLSGEPELFEYATGREVSHMLAVSSDANVAWTTDLGSKTVTRIALKERIAPISVTVGEEPEGIALSPDGSSLWVAARGSDEAFELDPETMEVRSTLTTGSFPIRLAIRPQGDVAITSDLRDGGLSVVDLGTKAVVRTIAVSSPEEAERRIQVTILWSDDGERIYVAETASNTVAEVDFASGTVLRRLAAGDGGDGLAIVP